MSASLLAVVTVIYLAVAASMFLQDRSPLALVYFAYALGNIGFIWELCK